MEWDERKRLANLAKHGLDFSDAAEVLAGPCLERLDTRKDYGEDRWAVLGRLRGRVVYLWSIPSGTGFRALSHCAKPR